MAFDKKWLLYGGIGVAVLAGGYMLLSSGGASASPDATNTGDLSTLYPNMVIGGGGSTGTDSSGTDQLSQLLSAQLQQSTQNYDLNKANIESNERISMATLSTQKEIALNTNQTNIAQALAGQLGNIVDSMQYTWGSKFGGGHSGLGAVAGAIGFSDGKITFDIAGTQQGAAGLTGQENYEKVKNSPLITNVSPNQAIANVGANK